MTEENHKLFMMLAGRELNEPQLEYFKSKLFNKDLDIAELFFTAVSCEQFDAARTIINFGWDMNQETDTMAYELFVCANHNFSKFCIDFYLSNGLIITEKLINKMLKIAEEEQEGFDYNNTLELVKVLKQKIRNQ